MTATTRELDTWQWPGRPHPAASPPPSTWQPSRATETQKDISFLSTYARIDVSHHYAESC